MGELLGPSDGQKLRLRLGEDVRPVPVVRQFWEGLTILLGK